MPIGFRQVAPFIISFALAVACRGGGAITTNSGGSEGVCGGSGNPSASQLVVIPADAGEVIRAVRSAGARAVLVNVWATWCQPCVEEFPELVLLRRNYLGKGLEVIFVSADFENELSRVKDFLFDQGVDFTTYMKTGDDMEFIDGISPRWSGALPATFIFDGSGRLRHFWEGKASYEEFEERVLDTLNK